MRVLRAWWFSVLISIDQVASSEHGLLTLLINPFNSRVSTARYHHQLKIPKRVFILRQTCVRPEISADMHHRKNLKQEKCRFLINRCSYLTNPILIVRVSTIWSISFSNFWGDPTALSLLFSVSLNRWTARRIFDFQRWLIHSCGTFSSVPNDFKPLELRRQNDDADRDY